MFQKAIFCSAALTFSLNALAGEKLTDVPFDLFDSKLPSVYINKLPEPLKLKHERMLVDNHNQIYLRLFSEAPDTRNPDKLTSKELDILFELLVESWNSKNLKQKAEIKRRAVAKARECFRLKEAQSSTANDKKYEFFDLSKTCKNLRAKNEDYLRARIAELQHKYTDGRTRSEISYLTNYYVGTLKQAQFFLHDSEALLATLSAESNISKPALKGVMRDSVERLSLYLIQDWLSKKSISVGNPGASDYIGEREERQWLDLQEEAMGGGGAVQQFTPEIERIAQ